MDAPQPETRKIKVNSIRELPNAWRRLPAVSNGKTIEEEAEAALSVWAAQGIVPAAIWLHETKTKKIRFIVAPVDGAKRVITDPAMLDSAL